MARKKAEDQQVVSLEDQWYAIEVMTRAADDGEIPESQLRRRLAAVWRSNTPHELWKATGGRVGDKRRGDWAAWRGAAYRVLAIIPLALISLWILAWGLRQYYSGN